MNVFRSSSSCLLLLWATGLLLAQPADDGDSLVPMVLELLADPDSDVRALGLEQVRSSAPGAEATRQFAAHLSKLAPDAQVALLGALAERGDAAAKPELLRLLESSDNPRMRIAAIEAIGPLGNAQDVAFLVQRLVAGPADEQAAARKSLVRLSGPEVTSGLTALLDGETDQRVAVIGVLVSRRALETIPLLLSAALDEDAAVRTAAMAALGELAGPEHLPGMVQGVLKSQPGPERAAAEKAVMFVCARIADPQQRAIPLLNAIDTLEPSKRREMLPTLGRVGGPPAWERVLAVLAASEAAEHDAGIRALCNWPDASVSSELIERVRLDPHANHRTQALRALIRVAPLADGRSEAQRLELLAEALTLCSRDEERKLALQRAPAIRTLASLEFVLPFVEHPQLSATACQAVVELAHHRQLRDANKAAFHAALDQVIRVSKNPTVVERARRYQRGQTWTGTDAAAQ
jgi:HEAT repeat protein